jgi:hypothetical protein
MSSRSANYLSNSYLSAPQGVEYMHAQDGRSVGNLVVGRCGAEHFNPFDNTSNNAAQYDKD